MNASEAKILSQGTIDNICFQEYTNIINSIKNATLRGEFYISNITHLCNDTITKLRLNGYKIKYINCEHHNYYRISWGE